ncbi:DedA family protein [Lysinibacillus odysseyi]|uniref:Alkaline phosphatase n=1 Tax=Lysinibacillus odysseyi 34hs-1 = NBRC 100172 TaxID=1220589 RepID=A0A0A3IEU8_9BACI|nr:DedA family protein [Lysinibacillus odysseyi]KGR82010.1 alkaline phosphatase [Lysinibacillus odysseyi 34hs-1 = NBRC 100172]
MEEWITDLMNNWGYFGVAFLVALENLFPPIPSEFILTFGGFMTTRTNMTVPGVIMSSTIGSVAGAICLYYIGKLVSLSLLKKILAGKLGTFLRLKPRDIDRSVDWFQRRGYLTVFFCRFIPVIRSLISIPAGVARMPLLPFITYTVLGTVLWNTILIVLGALAGDNWSVILDMFNRYKYYLFIPVIVFGSYFLYKFYSTRK